MRQVDCMSTDISQLICPNDIDSKWSAWTDVMLLCWATDKLDIWVGCRSGRRSSHNQITQSDQSY